MPGAGRPFGEGHDIALLQPATLPQLVVLRSRRLGVGAACRSSPSAPLGPRRHHHGRGDLGSTADTDDGTERRGLIQFDAAVNPGSSGGPLLNQQGEVIGIVVAIADPTKDGFFIGISFAVPIGTAIGAGGGAQPPK